MRRLSLRYDSLAELTRDFETNLLKGRAFVRGAPTGNDRERVELELQRPDGRSLVCAADAVFANDEGVGLALVDRTEAGKEALRQFAALEGQGDEAVGELTSSEGDATEGDAPTPPGGEDEAGDERTPLQINLHARIRSLSPQAREELARKGTLAERVAVERAFGGAVWEALLSNPQVTSPEIARIARMGALPKPLVGNIVANSAWLASGEVQRSLLSNPRCTGAHLDKVVAALTTSDLSKLLQRCPYRGEVRSAVQRAAKTRLR